MQKPVNVATCGGSKYSFVGRPDFNRIIRENPEAEVIIVSRGDRLVVFLFRMGHVEWTNKVSETNILRRAECDLGVGPFDLTNKMAQNGEQLPREWAAHWATDPGYIKDLRQIAQYIVRARTGKHTVEVLP